MSKQTNLIFLTLETITTSGHAHTSSIAISAKNGVTVCGALAHSSEIVASKTNIKTLRKLADELERRIGEKS